MSPDQTYLLVLKGLLQKWGAAKAHCGAKTPAAAVLIGMIPSEGHHFLIKTWPTQQAEMIQTKQPIGWENSPTPQKGG